MKTKKRNKIVRFLKVGIASGKNLELTLYFLVIDRTFVFYSFLFKLKYQLYLI